MSPNSCDVEGVQFLDVIHIHMWPRVPRGHANKNRHWAGLERVVAFIWRSSNARE
jgi:hypothetical protein